MPCLELIELSAEKASRLTRQLLAFSRKQKIAPEILDPAVLLRDISVLVQRTLGENITLKLQLASLWMISEDRTQFEQIILNLCVNARHAMPAGGEASIATRDVAAQEPELEVPPGYFQHVAARPGAGNQVLIEIADTGHGIDERVLMHIFEPFYSSREKEEGTGLGLSVVYGMVMQAGGGIHVITRKDHGTTFQIYMPKASEVELLKREWGKR